MGISLCMIARDEADCIANALESVRNIVDEIVLVDTGSCDATREIAARFGARVFEIVWPNDFAAARNESLAHARESWILVLDADEVISKHDGERIRALVAENAHPLYMLVQTTYQRQSATFNWRQNDLPDAEAKGYPGYFESPLTRLFRNDPAIRFHGVVHENARYPDDRIAPISTDIRIHHYGKYISEERKLAKAEHYLRLGFEKCRQHPNLPIAHFELGVQLWELGRDREAIEAFARCLELEPQREEALLACASIETRAGRLAQAIGYYERALKANPANARIYTYMPSLLLAAGELDAAARVIDLARATVPDSPAVLINEAVLHLRRREWRLAELACRKALMLNASECLAHLNLGYALAAQGKDVAARESLRRALDDPETMKPARRRLAELALKDERWEEAIDTMIPIVDSEDADDSALLLFGVACVKAGHFEQARRCLTRMNPSQERPKPDAAALAWCFKTLEDAAVDPAAERKMV